MLGLPPPGQPGYQGPRGQAAVIFAADQAARGLGMELVHAGPGSAVVRMRVALQMLNGHSVCHGGYVFMLACTAFECAASSAGPVTIAEGADITFTGRVREGDVLVAAATQRTQYGLAGIFDVTVRRGDDVVAEFRGRGRALA